MSHQTIQRRQKKMADCALPKKSADFVTDSFFYLLVSFLVRIGENPPIRVLHSLTIIELKKIFVASFKDITYVIYNDPTLLHQTNIHTNKLCKNNRPIFILINVWSQYSQLKRFILPIFSAENKLSIQI